MTPAIVAEAWGGPKHGLARVEALMGGVVQSTRTAISSSMMPSLAKAVGTASIGSLAGLVVNTEASDVNQLALKASLGVSACPRLPYAREPA